MEMNGIGWAVKQLHGGLKVTRAGWISSVWLELMRPGSDSDMTEPYVFATSLEGESQPWGATQEDMLAADWELVDGQVEVMPSTPAMRMDLAEDVLAMGARGDVPDPNDAVELAKAVLELKRERDRLLEAMRPFADAYRRAYGGPGGLHTWARRASEDLSPLVWGRLMLEVTRAMGPPKYSDLPKDADLVEVFVVFDGPPSHESGRFIEVVDEENRGVRIDSSQSWRQRPDGHWTLGPFLAKRQDMSELPVPAASEGSV